MADVLASLDALKAALAWAPAVFLAGLVLTLATLAARGRLRERRDVWIRGGDDGSEL